MMIDTHEAVKNLRDGGFTDKQAESLINVFKHFATKEDLQQSELRLENKIDKMSLTLTIKLSSIMFGLLLAFKILDKII
jgi:hypothetical protein